MSGEPRVEQDMKVAAQPSNRATYVCQHVFDCSRGMDYIHYDSDRDILITCSGDDHDFSNAKEVRVVGLGHLITRDPTLLDVLELHPGAWAERSEDDRRWRVFKK
jgi:hypothetical protein